MKSKKEYCEKLVNNVRCCKQWHTKQVNDNGDCVQYCKEHYKEFKKQTQRLTPTHSEPPRIQNKSTPTQSEKVLPQITEPTIVTSGEDSEIDLSSSEDEEGEEFIKYLLSKEQGNCFGSEEELYYESEADESGEEDYTNIAIPSEKGIPKPCIRVMQLPPQFKRLYKDVKEVNAAYAEEDSDSDIDDYEEEEYLESEEEAPVKPVSGVPSRFHNKLVMFGPKCIQILEKIIAPTANITGLSTVLFQDDAFVVACDDCVNEIWPMSETEDSSSSASSALFSIVAMAILQIVATNALITPKINALREKIASAVLPRIEGSAQPPAQSEQPAQIPQSTQPASQPASQSEYGYVPSEDKNDYSQFVSMEYL